MIANIGHMSFRKSLPPKGLLILGKTVQIVSKVTIPVFPKMPNLVHSAGNAQHLAHACRQAIPGAQVLVVSQELLDILGRKHERLQVEV